MASSIPKMMRALVIAKYCKPFEYNIATIFTPSSISKLDEIIIKVYAAAINPIDVKLAAGFGKLLQGNGPFPYHIGYDLAGVVVGTGNAVAKFKVGDEVSLRLQNDYRGSIAEYTLTSPATTELKPTSLTFAQAAAAPLAGMTAV